MTTTGLKILVVDDVGANRNLIGAYLKRLGHRAILAEDGEKALVAFKAERPDLCIVDLMMPVMDGFDTTRHIRQMTGDSWVPVIILSALNDEENLVKALSCGADDFLNKPISFPVFEAKMRTFSRLLGQHRGLEHSLDMVRSITDGLIDGIVTINKQGIIQRVNPKVKTLFGFDESELIGRNVSILMPEPYATEHDSYLARYFAHGASYAVGRAREVTGKRKDGSTFPVELGVSEIQMDGETLFIGSLRDITEQKRSQAQILEQARILQMHYEEQQREAELAQRVLEHQVRPDLMESAGVHYSVTPATNFSGDLVLAARSPDGRLYALLADATGHGLSAAVSVLPMVQEFYRLVERGAQLGVLVSSINAMLVRSLPMGRFVAAALACLDEKAHQGEVWVGGVPDVLMVDSKGEIVKQFASEHLPLGIDLDADEMGQTTAFTWAEDARLVMLSDGVVEATDAQGIPFGDEGVAETLKLAAKDDVIQCLKVRVSMHLKGIAAHDDMSVLVVECPAAR